MKLIGKMVISWSDLFLITSGMWQGSLGQEITRPFVTTTSTGKEEIFSDSTITFFSVFGALELTDPLTSWILPGPVVFGSYNFA